MNWSSSPRKCSALCCRVAGAQHCANPTWHSTLDTAHLGLCISQSTLFTLHTATHFLLYTPHFTVHTLRDYTFCDPLCALHSGSLVSLSFLKGEWESDEDTLEKCEFVINSLDLKPWALNWSLIFLQNGLLKTHRNWEPMAVQGLAMQPWSRDYHGKYAERFKTLCAETCALRDDFNAHLLLPHF